MPARGVSRSFLDFPKDFAGQIFRPSDPGYPSARMIYNCLTQDATPALIARCANEDDVVLAVRYAAERGEPIAVRSGGHLIDASAMPDSAFVIDLSALTSITVDAANRTARAQAGVLLGDFDVATQQYGLATTAGTVSTTGLAGLTLGGGIGFLMRRHGVTVDNLLSCDLVTTDGRRVSASEHENPDLFWGLRGAGHNLGIVTSFEYRLHEVGPDVFNGELFFPFDQAATVLAGVREYMKTASRDLMVIAGTGPLPALPSIPPQSYGTPGAMVIVTFSGDVALADDAIQPLVALGQPLANLIERKSYVEAQARLTESCPPGRRIFTRGGYLTELTDEVIAIAIRNLPKAPAPTRPGPSAGIMFWSLGGAVNDTPEDVMAFSREGATWMWETVGQWDIADKDAEFIGWVNTVLGDLTPHSRANGYVNLTVDQGADWLTGLYGSPEKFRRLVELKAEWDPHNLLRYNKNIKAPPSPSAPTRETIDRVAPALIGSPASSAALAIAG